MTDRTSDAGMTADAQAATGIADFDFLLGRWSVRHRRLKERLTGCTEWIEFMGTASVRTILGGLGNFDECIIPLPDGQFVGATLRLFDPSTGLWTIYWMDSRRPGRLDPPMVGRFVNSEGLFLGDDSHEGRPIRVRFIWSRSSSDTCRWEQAFSIDHERTWEINWTMDFIRQSATANEST